MWRPPRIVAIGGGTGLPVVLSGLAETLDPLARQPDRLTAIVTVTDDGGSSGQLRRGLGIIPPGDIRNCLAALAADDLPLASVLQHRFAEDSVLGGHPVGNILLAALFERTGSVESAIGELSRMLRLRGQVVPCSAADVHLRAHLRDGRVVVGETAIVAARQPIDRLEIVPQVQPIPEAIRALVNADVVVLGPGSLYTSVLSNLLITGIGATLGGLSATRIYVANLMTEPGETDGYTVEDHLDAILRHVTGSPIDIALVSRAELPSDVVARYRREGAERVCRRSALSRYRGIEIVERELGCAHGTGKIRHDPDSLATAILEIAAARAPRPAEKPSYADAGKAGPDDCAFSG
jgi:uncharacterized cofD-like protein